MNFGSICFEGHIAKFGIREFEATTGLNCESLPLVEGEHGGPKNQNKRTKSIKPKPIEPSNNVGGRSLIFKSKNRMEFSMCNDERWPVYETD